MSIERVKKVVPANDKLDSVMMDLAKIDPLLWVMHFRMLNKQPFVFDVSTKIEATNMAALKPREQMRLLTRHRPFLMQPLRDQSANKVYEKGRQVGVSELALTEEFWFLWANPGTKWVHTFPRDKQLTDFGTTRIKPALEETPLMQSLIGVPDQVYTKRIGQSYLLLRSAWESNLGEGIDADGVTFDEKDRMKEGIEVAFKESLSSSKYGLMREVSTPTLPGRGVDQAYQKSCQFEWFVKCTKCGEAQIIEYPDNIVQMMDIPVGATELEEGTYEYRCKKEKCRGPLDRLHGEWIAKYPSRQHITGYHMPQLIAPWISATKVMQKLIDYKFKQLWSNYVLGRPSVGEVNLLTHEDFEWSIAGHEMVASRTGDWSAISVGIDWGHLNWMVVLGKNASNGRTYLLAAMVFEDDYKNPLTSVHQIDSFIAPFSPDIIVADAGFGKDRNSYLLKKYPERVYACWYNPSEQRSRTFQPQWSTPEQARLLADRTMTLKETCRAIKEREIGFPRWDRTMELYEKHFLNLAPLRIEEEGEIYEIIDKTGADHFAHATAYALLGLQKEDGNFVGDISF